MVRPLKRQVGRQLEADLEATVAAETLALRIGDRVEVASDLIGTFAWSVVA